MKLNKDALLLYAVTDRAWLGNERLISQVEKAVAGGATFIQMREKELDFETFLEEAKEISVFCKEKNIPFVINDNVEIAVLSNADGVHIGQDDMNAQECRKILGEDKILGVSCQSVEQAIEAEKNGADYLGVGAAFSTSTKEDCSCITHEAIKNICKAVSIPVIAIGGINEDNILRLKNAGLAGVAVVSAIFAQKDIMGATKKLLELSKEMIKSEV